MSAEIVQFVPKEQIEKLDKLGRKLIYAALWDSDRTWSGEQTAPEYKYIAPSDDCA